MTAYRLISAEKARTPISMACRLLARQFRPADPNQLWVADITYLRTWEGWLYLAAVQDAYSRAIVGWAMAEHMRKELVVDALQMAVHRRRPAPGVIHHSDQGSQYVSLAFGQAARDAGISRSMGSKGDAYDNAVAESFFATLKKELVHRRSWPTRHELTGEDFEYIEVFYNRVRRHSDARNARAVGVREQHSQRSPTQLRRSAAQGLTEPDNQPLEPESPTLSGEAGELHDLSRKDLFRFLSRGRWRDSVEAVRTVGYSKGFSHLR